MIFLTLGTQLPFDRLVRAMDDVAGQIDEPVFAQIGQSEYRPQNMQYADYLTPAEFKVKIKAARVIVGHAGMGTILTAGQERKPLIIMARKAACKEHRNDHQLATLSQMRRIPGVHALDAEADLLGLVQDSTLAAMSDTATPARDKLVNRLTEELCRIKRSART